MSNATLERKCDLPQLVLEGILLDSKVPLKHWTEWFDLTYYGIRPSDAAPLPGVRNGPLAHLDGHFRSVLPGEGNQVSSEGVDTLQEAAYKRCLTATHRHQFVHFRQRPRAIMRGYRGDPRIDRIERILCRLVQEVASGALLPFGQRALLYAPTELIEPFTFTSVAPCCSRRTCKGSLTDPTILKHDMCLSLCQVHPRRLFPPPLPTMPA